MEPFLLSSSLTGVMAQRLVRTLCPDCRQAAPATDEENACWALPMREPSLCTIRRAAPPVITKVSADGLPSMSSIVVDATLRDLIHRQAGALERYVRQHSAGIRSNGIEKVLAGEASR